MIQEAIDTLENLWKKSMVQGPKFKRSNLRSVSKKPVPGSDAGAGAGVDTGTLLAVVFLLVLLHHVQVVPVLTVPARYEPDISLGLSHLQVVCLAHDMAGGWLVEICYDHLGSSLLQVPQVLRELQFVKQR